MNISKKMKQTKLSILALLLLVLGFSCNDLVDEFPVSEIGPNNFFKNNKDLEAAMIGAYDAFQQSYRSNYFLWGEFRSDNFQPANDGRATLNSINIVNNNIQDDNPNLRWDRIYSIFERVNQVIENAPNISDADPSILAEAHALRAKVYFDIVRVWGDVPLFTEPIKLLSDTKRPATSAATILNDVVIPDMLKAEELMVNPDAEYRFSTSSILAMQAEVYMWLGENLKAKTAIEKLMGLNTHRLVTNETDWDDLFYNNNTITSLESARGKIQEGPELIMSINYNLDEIGNANRSAINVLFYSGIRTFVLSEKIENLWRNKFPVDSAGWVDKYPNTDPVLTEEIPVLDSNGVLKDSIVKVYGDWRYYFCREGRVDRFNSVEIGEANCAKWQQVAHGTQDSDADVVLYRYADMVLLLAEAELKLGNATRAFDLINDIRTARLLPQATGLEYGSTPEEQLNFLLEERQLELYGEGKRWWDLLRNDKTIEVLNPILQARKDGSAVFSDARLLDEGLFLWPIFTEHLIENDLLKPNTANFN